MKIDLAGKVDFWDVYRKLEDLYFNKVEDIIRKRLSYTVLSNPDAFSGAQELIDSVMIDGISVLRREVFPGSGIYWDNKIELSRTYTPFPFVIVDVVDGAEDLRRGGTEVTSTLGVISPDGRMPLAVVSYPFGRERVVDIKGVVYRLPHNFDFKYQDLVKYRLKQRSSKSDLSSLDVAERYDEFRDKTRERLDGLRHHVSSSIKRPIGSIAKMITSVAVGPFDIFISKKEKPEQFFDYGIPSQIVQDLGGIFRTLNGKKPKGMSNIEGLIAASTKENYFLFIGFLKGD